MANVFGPGKNDYVERLNDLWDHVGVLWRGDWDAGAAYEVGDLARYGKDVWRRLVAGTTAGAPSADLANWELFVEGGIDGIDGTNGTDGIDGTNGTNGLNGADGADGLDGTNGTNGTNGANGADGADGVDGVQPWTTPPVAWAATTIYTATAPANSVTYGGESYVCSTSHTSTGSFDATKWTKIAAKGTDGAGSGDVSGPASAADGKVALFDGTSGKLIKDSGLALSGSNTGDETGASVATLLHAASAKTTLVDADEVNGTNSASSWALIRTTWANVWTYIKSKADTFYAPKGAATASGLTLSTGKLLGRATAGTGAIEELAITDFARVATANTFSLAQDFATGSNIASASTLNLDSATGNRVHVTGTTTITAVTLTRGPRTVIFDGILTLTHHATNNNLPGGANITTAAGDRAIYESDGTSVYCVAYIKANGQPVAGAGVGDHCISLHTGNGHGSTNNKIRRYTTAMINVGTAMTYTDTSADGASITINEAGFYAISSTDINVNTGLYTAGASVNSNQLTTSIESISVANRLMWGSSGSSPYPGAASVVAKLAVNDVVRPHGDGNPSNTTDKVTFTIRKVGNV